MKVKFLILVLVSIAAFSQQKGDVSIVWSEKSEYSFGSNKFNITQIKSENFSFDNSKKAIYYNLNLPQQESIDENSLEITNVIFKDISVGELGDLNPKNIPTSIKASLRSSFSRDKIYAYLNDTFEYIKGGEKITYYNNSPNTLTEAYFNLYQNAFNKNSLTNY
jgi:hypothetical protein